MRMLCGEQRVPHPTLLLIFDHQQPQSFDIMHLGRHLDGRGHRRIKAAWRGPMTMGAELGKRDLSRRLQHRERLQTPCELRPPAGIDKAELRAHLAPKGSAALKRTPCHNVLEASLELRRTQCLEDLALEPHVADYTPPGFLCSASLVGTGQA